MADNELLDRLNLFEAVVIGIYGNWLINLLDKVSFEKTIWILGFYYQPLCMVTSFITLLFLFAYSIFAPELVTRRFGFILGFGHAIANLGAIWVEGMTKKIWFFYYIGTILFLVIYLVEHRRVNLQHQIDV